MNTAQQLICQNSSSVQNKYNLSISLKVKASERRSARISVYFLLCQSCFWCASHFVDFDDLAIIDCPVCNDRRIEKIPVSNN
jgi:hypothetical protein